MSSVTVIQVPTGTKASPALQQAHERLLSVFGLGKPVQVVNLQELIDTRTASIFVAVAGLASNQDIPLNYSEASWWANCPERAYVGSVTMLEASSLTRTTARLEHVAVEPDYQGRGIGKQLVERAMLVARAHGIRRIDLTSAPSKVRAQELYRSMGFRLRETNNWRWEETER